MIFIVLHDRTPRIVDPITAQAMSDFRGRGDITNWSRHVRFSNRPFGVKHFQTTRRCSVDVAHGLVLLFGIGT